MKDIIKYKEYIGAVHYSTANEVFFGKIEGIDDLITFEADTVEQLKSSFQEAVEDYLELCASLEKSPQKSYKGTFNVRIKPDLHKLAAYKSVELGLSLNQFVEQAINEKIKNKSSN